MPPASHGPSVLRVLLWLSLAPCCAAEPEHAPIEIPPFKSCEQPDLAPAQVIEPAGTDFTLAGKTIVPNGVGSYPLLEHIGLGRLDDVRDVFAQARALRRPIVRTNAFMDGGDNPGRLRDADGTIREEGLIALDTLLAEAQAADVRVLLLLTNYWEDYGGARAVLDAVAPGEDLPTDAFFSDPRALEAQEEYVDALVSRVNSRTGAPYASDPTVFAWELINEARCTDAHYCDADTLPRWAKRMSDAARKAGALQPIAWGGSGYVGRYGEDLAAVGARGGVDILTAHVYPLALNPTLLSKPRAIRVPAAIQAGARHMRDALDVAEQLGMPLLVEEFGWAPPDGATRDEERAEVYRAWLAFTQDRGIAALPWMIAERERIDFDGYLIRPDDRATNDVLRCK